MPEEMWRIYNISNIEFPIVVNTFGDSDTAVRTFFLGYLTKNSETSYKAINHILVRGVLLNINGEEVR